MEKKTYVHPDICIVNEYGELCYDHIVVPISQYPALTKEQTLPFIEDEEEDNDTWIIEE